MGLAPTEIGRVWWSFAWRWVLYSLPPFLFVAVDECYPNALLGVKVHEFLSQHAGYLEIVWIVAMSRAALTQALNKHFPKIVDRVNSLESTRVELSLHAKLRS